MTTLIFSDVNPSVPLLVCGIILGSTNKTMVMKYVHVCTSNTNNEFNLYWTSGACEGKAVSWHVHFSRKNYEHAIWLNNFGQSSFLKVSLNKLCKYECWTLLFNSVLK